jgi:hypothetical protein
MMQHRRKLYPDNWTCIAYGVKEACGWRCEHCHIRHGSTRTSKRTGEKYRVWLHAAHRWFGDTDNPTPDLLCLCPTCHGRYDYRLRMQHLTLTLELLKHRLLLARCA